MSNPPAGRQVLPLAFRKTLAGRLRRLLVGRARTYAPERLPRPAIVFSPHQDDETLGCGGTILKKRQAGADLALVFMTDGGTSHQKLMDPSRLAPIRRREALAAAEVLGLEPTDTEFLEFPNRQLLQHRQEAEELVWALLQRRRPAEVFLPYALEPPGDHLATHWIVRTALARWERPVRVLEYPIWFWEHFPWLASTIFGPRSRRGRLKASLRGIGRALQDLRCRLFVGDVLERKRAALAEHRSQMTRLIDDPGWATLPEVADGDFLACFFRRHELFQDYPFGS